MLFQMAFPEAKASLVYQDLQDPKDLVDLKDLQVSMELPGVDGPQGPPGPRGEPVSYSGTSGAVYIRWGRTGCSGKSELVYKGMPSS